MAGFRKSEIIRVGDEAIRIKEAISKALEYDKFVTVDIAGCQKNIHAYRTILGGKILSVVVRNLDNSFDFDCCVTDTESAIKEAAFIVLAHIRFAKENSGS